MSDLKCLTLKGKPHLQSEHYAEKIWSFHHLFTHHECYLCIVHHKVKEVNDERSLDRNKEDDQRTNTCM